MQSGPNGHKLPGPHKWQRRRRPHECATHAQPHQPLKAMAPDACKTTTSVAHSHAHMAYCILREPHSASGSGTQRRMHGGSDSGRARARVCRRMRRRSKRVRGRARGHLKALARQFARRQQRLQRRLDSHCRIRLAPGAHRHAAAATATHRAWKTHGSHTSSATAVAPLLPPAHRIRVQSRSAQRRRSRGCVPWFGRARWRPRRRQGRRRWQRRRRRCCSSTRRRGPSEPERGRVRYSPAKVKPRPRAA